MAWRCGSYTIRFMHPTHWLISTQVDYQPRAGSVLLFTQELLHEGVVVEEACRKFTMRSEVMYSGHHIGRIMNPGSPPRGNNR